MCGGCNRKRQQEKTDSSKTCLLAVPACLPEQVSSSSGRKVRRTQVKVIHCLCFKVRERDDRRRQAGKDVVGEEEEEESKREEC